MGGTVRIATVAMPTKRATCCARRCNFVCEPQLLCLIIKCASHNNGSTSARRQLWHGGKAVLCHFLFAAHLLVLSLTLSSSYVCPSRDFKCTLRGFRVNSLLITIVDKFPAAVNRKMQLEDKCLATKDCK